MRGRLRLTPALRDSIKIALIAALGTRVIVWSAGIVGFDRLAAHSDFTASACMRRLAVPFHSDFLNSLIASASRWDSDAYLRIATHGYGYGKPPTWAYFPAYPLVMKAVGWVVGTPYFAGIIVSMVALVIALVLLHRLALLDLDANGARWTVIVLVVFPTSFYFSAIYTESLFIACSIGAVYAARLGRWAPAGLLGAVASATRPNGVLVALPLLMLYAQSREGPPWQARGWISAKQIKPSILWIALVPAGLGAYMLYLGLSGHSPMLWATSQSAGGHWGFLGVFSSVARAVGRVPQELQQLATGDGRPDQLITYPFVNLLDLAALIFALAGLWLARRLVPPAYIAYGLVQLIAVSGFEHVLPLISVSRHILIVFPAFIGWGAWLAAHLRPRLALVPVSVVLLVLLTAAWATGSFIA